MAGLVVRSDASHEGHEAHPSENIHETTGAGHPVPGASFQVFAARTIETAGVGGADPAQADELDAAVQTVVKALTVLLQHRTAYPRVDEAVKKDALHAVIVEPTVVNREGKTFPFLVSRTKDPGRVNLLVSAASLKDKGLLNHPDQLAPVLAREFQWVISKADTASKPKTVAGERDLARAPIRTDKEVRELSAEGRTRVLQQLFETYLRTVDDLRSLEGQPYYEVGTTTLVPPSHSDSATKLYEIRVREALQKIMQDPYFAARTPKAVTSLLNGKIWSVAFVKIDQRDWATRTRVLPKEQSVRVGLGDLTIQPASILVNAYRTAAPDDPYYADTKGLPMGALSADQLARVIAWEIERNIVEKSMTGHVAQDAMSAPK